jgi:hypothetical protein
MSRLKPLALACAALAMAWGCSSVSVTGDALDTADGASPDLALDSALLDGGGDVDCCGPDEVDAADAVAPGEFGAPCDDNGECFSDFCVEGPAGRQCTSLCDAQCPAGWACKAVGGQGDVTFICVYDHVAYCAPCDVDADCAHPLTPIAGDRCVARADGAGSFCATACAGIGGCPDGATCEAHADGGSVCVPTSGQCQCSPYAVLKAAATSCTATSAAGTCAGRRTCAGGSLTACDAATPAAESCNSADDDCDGVTDEGFVAPGGPAVGQPCDGEGACGFGLVECAGDQATRCSTEPGGTMDQSAEERCNAVDDDCDGATDEGFDVGAACEGVGACGAGVVECFGPDAAGCSSDAGGSESEAVTERCSGVDDDCDGATDEGFSVGAACEGAGECGAGTIECLSATEAHCSTEAGGSADESAPELCDGKDNDCSGLADDHDAGCPCDVQYVLGTAYMFCTDAKPWADARDACASWGYVLATIEDKPENDGVVALALPKKASPWWIGLNDRATEGSHVWQSGSGATYRNWAPQEPNNFQHGPKCGASAPDEDCVQFSPSSVGVPPEWNDEPCACPYPYVCRQL